MNVPSKLLAAALILAVATTCQTASAKIKVAVVADSLATNSAVPWPAILAKHLGSECEVKVFSANGLTVLNNTYRSIWTRDEYVHGRDYRPEAYKIAATGGPIGDGKGPDSGTFEAQAVPCQKGDLIRLVIDPNKNWGTDLTKVETFTINRVK